jgi:hypothetical protein
MGWWGNTVGAWKSRHRYIPGSLRVAAYRLAWPVLAVATSANGLCTAGPQNRYQSTFGGEVASWDRQSDAGSANGPTSDWVTWPRSI